MEINTPELLMIYKEIKAHPENWVQATWAMRGELLEDELRTRRHVDKLTPEQYDASCGTAFCIAGHAVWRNGDRLLWVGPAADSCQTPEGECMDISTRARDILGLNPLQSAELFAPSNTLDNIRQRIREWTGIDPEELA